jgi:hypothetical protein
MRRILFAVHDMLHAFFRAFRVFTSDLLAFPLYSIR